MAGGDRAAGRNKKKCEKYRNLRGGVGSKHPKGDRKGTDTHLYTYHADGTRSIRRPFSIGEPTSTIGDGPAHLATAVALSKRADREEALSLAMSLRPHLRARVTTKPLPAERRMNQPRVGSKV